MCVTRYHTLNFFLSKLEMSVWYPAHCLIVWETQREGSARTGLEMCRKKDVLLPCWAFLVAAMIALPVSGDTPECEWGTVGFEALCRAGMPSAACANTAPPEPPGTGKVQHVSPLQHSKRSHAGEDQRLQSHAHDGPASVPLPPPPPTPLKPAQYTIAVPGHLQVPC